MFNRVSRAGEPARRGLLASVSADSFTTLPSRRVDAKDSLP